MAARFCYSIRPLFSSRRREKGSSPPRTRYEVWRFHPARLVYRIKMVTKTPKLDGAGQVNVSLRIVDFCFLSQLTI